MSVILNEVRRATYLDSIVLMRIAREVAALPGVEEAGLMIGTPANKEILRDAGILGPEGGTAELYYEVYGLENGAPINPDDDHQLQAARRERVVTADSAP